MAMCVRLEDRAVLSISGADARTFLQDLVSNDVDKAAEGRAVYAALLTPQGKYLFDFLVVDHGDALWLDCEAARREALARRLAMYRLRAKVEIDAGLDGAVYAVFGPDAEEAATAIDGAHVYADPRLPALGYRAILAPDRLPPAGLAVSDRAAYDTLRMELGVPDGGRDLVPEKSFLLENGFEALGGVDFEKGCYVGQEVTARMKHRGLVRKRLVPVGIEGPEPEAGSPVLSGDAEVGEIRSVAGGLGLAMLRLDAIEAGAPLRAGPARLVPRKPDWADF